MFMWELEMRQIRRAVIGFYFIAKYKMWLNECERRGIQVHKNIVFSHRLILVKPAKTTQPAAVCDYSSFWGGLVI